MPRSQLDFALLAYVSSNLSLCIITYSGTSAACGDTGQCISDGTNAIVGNADLTFLHSAFSIINEPTIELGSKITSFM